MLMTAVFCMISMSSCKVDQTTSSPESGLHDIDVVTSHDTDVKVMILGTFHFTGGGNDVVNDDDIDDFLAPRRQAEIKAVLDKIEAYAPDKIMLELDLKHEDDFNQDYRAYLKGEYELRVNEREQLGMRLAARLDHERIYAIDYDNFLDFRGAIAAAKDLEQDHLLAAMEAETEQLIASFKSQEDMALDERLIKLNKVSEFDHKFYMRIAQMGSVEDPQGALQILTWWERNLVMFARTTQYAEPGDKVLIIVGSGHNYILHEFFSSAEGFKLVSPIQYLE